MPVRLDNETWRECVIRHAKPHGLEEEVLDEYDQDVATGTPEEVACWHNLFDWDCIDVLPGNQ